MIEAVLYSIFTVLAFFGVLKLFELVQAFALVKGKEKAVLVCKIKNNIESAEMTVRALATDVSNTVFVISDNLSVLHSTGDMEWFRRLFDMCYIQIKVISASGFNPPFKGFPCSFISSANILSTWIRHIKPPNASLR